MKSRTLQLAAYATALALFSAAAPPQRARTSTRATQKKTAARKPPEPPPLPCGDYLSFQVLLDRQGFSTGQIDGKPGPNLSHALAALQAEKAMDANGQPDCDTWNALGGDAGESPLMEYTISDEDMEGPFEPDIPADLAKQSSLPALGYRAPLEMIAERFHLSPALLQKLNEKIPIAAGQRIVVPAVTPFLVDAKPVPDAAADDITIQVSKDESALRATRSDGTLVFFAPVTTGSEHDPLPIGDWKVLGTQWHPVFHYNPDLFWDAKPRDARANIQPGPNNPVGVVWVSLSKEHYGLHGTPEPGNVGHTESHGCVRLTNWDAARVAALVRPGTPVLFR
ncbi:MAG TPA: L,D-transpeptidase family protein [Vicinamibacterales bacterium]|nr:L,D-transpeptidase family protein [Vicinamibacterales bacterium]